MINISEKKHLIFSDVSSKTSCFIKHKANDSYSRCDFQRTMQPEVESGGTKEEEACDTPARLSIHYDWMTGHDPEQ